MKTYEVTVVYEVEAKDVDHAEYKVWDAVLYGKEETAHSCAVEGLLRVGITAAKELG